MKTLCLKVVNPLLLTAALLAASPHAFAQEAKCTDAKMMVTMITKLSSLPEELTDKLIMDMELHVQKEDGSPMTERMFYKTPESGDEVTIKRDENGKLINLDVLAGVAEDGEICRQAEDGQTPEAKSKTDMNMQFVFLDTGGSHSTQDLLEGLSDGTAQMKSLAPGPAKLLVPKLRYYVVTPDKGANASGQDLSLTFYKGGEPVDFKPQYFRAMPVLGQSELKKAKIDRVEISGGKYRLMAMPKPDKKDLSDSPQNLAQTENSTSDPKAE